MHLRKLSQAAWILRAIAHRSVPTSHDMGGQRSRTCCLKMAFTRAAASLLLACHRACLLPCRCNDLLQQVLSAPADARVVQLMDDMSDEVHTCAALLARA